jgi:hypothetical protein
VGERAREATSVERRFASVTLEGLIDATGRKGYDLHCRLNDHSGRACSDQVDPVRDVTRLNEPRTAIGYRVDDNADEDGGERNGKSRMPETFDRVVERGEEDLRVVEKPYTGHDKVENHDQDIQKQEGRAWKRSDQRE